MPRVARSEPSCRTGRLFAAGAVALALSTSLLGACAGKEASTSAPPRTTAASNQHPGQQVYLKSCARCHGENFEGRRGEPGIDGAKLASLGDQRLRITIASGKGKMPGFSKLSQGQVDALISYLKAAA